MFSVWKKEKRDLRSQFLGRGVDTNSLPTFHPPKLTLVIYFNLSQILVSSDTQLLSKPELIAHPQSLMGLSGIRNQDRITLSVHGVLQSWRRPVSWFLQALRAVKFYKSGTSLTVNAALTVQSVNWKTGLHGLLRLLGSTRRNCKLWQ